jgi:hypothetical protein
MTGGPHPMMVIMTTERRRRELLAEADRDRLILLARREPALHQPWIHFSAVLVIVVALVLMLAMSTAMS